MPHDIVDLSQLHQFITAHYSLEALRMLCFQLGLPYDELGGEGLSKKARELLLHLGWRRAFDQLLDALRRGRPEAFKAAGLGEVTLNVLYDALPTWETGGRLRRAGRPNRSA